MCIFCFIVRKLCSILRKKALYTFSLIVRHACSEMFATIQDNKGVDLEDSQLIDLISESTNMSKTMEE
jgi:hypothetical protein